MSNKYRVAVLGAGSWGTALALQFAHAGHETYLWGRDVALQTSMRQRRENSQYLPGIIFPPMLKIADTLPSALEQAQLLLIATPSASILALTAIIKPYIKTQHQLVCATKGLCQGKLLYQLLTEQLPQITDIALLSGPSFALEVARQLPTAVIIASANQVFANALAQAMSHQFFRVYTSDDMIGVSIGAAVKNVLAVAVGISDGMGFGANARAALITRGLNEMMTLGLALGAEAKTLNGLSGLGDLVLTCTDDQSRNRRFGLAIGQGQSIAAAQASIGQVVESVDTALEVYQLSQQYALDLPIITQIYQVIHQGLSATAALQCLFARKLKAE